MLIFNYLESLKTSLIMTIVNPRKGYITNLIDCRTPQEDGKTPFQRRASTVPLSRIRKSSNAQSCNRTFQSLWSLGNRRRPFDVPFSESLRGPTDFGTVPATGGAGRLNQCDQAGRHRGGDGSLSWSNEYWIVRKTIYTVTIIIRHIFCTIIYLVIIVILMIIIVIY